MSGLPGRDHNIQWIHSLGRITVREGEENRMWVQEASPCLDEMHAELLPFTMPVSWSVWKPAKTMTALVLTALFYSTARDRWHQ